MTSVVVLFEHQDFIVVLKPTAVQMHKADGARSIISLLYELSFRDLFLVHRLDADTSGLLILAKNQKAATVISTMFQQRRIEKYYIALSDKKPTKKQGHVLGDMKNIRNGNYALTRDLSNPAYTQFKSQSIALDDNTSLRLFLLKPYTGKTHQLRVALKSVGAAILGDPRYSKSNADRMYLHAWGLRFNYLGIDYQFVEFPNEGVLFNNDGFRQHPLMLADPWSIDWPAPKSGFSVHSHV